MTRSPLMAAAVLTAGLLIAACGSTPVGHGGSPKGKATPTPTAKPLSAAAAAEQGFKAWGQALVLLSGPMPAASRPDAAADVRLLGQAFDPASLGVLQALGHGLALTEDPPGCMAALWTVIGDFERPASAPNSVGTGPTSLVVRGGGIACATEAGGEAYMAIKASAPTVTYLLLGSMVPLPPVAGLPGLPAQVWTPTVVATCQTGWVEGAGADLPGGAVPGC